MLLALGLFLVLIVRSANAGSGAEAFWVLAPGEGRNVPRRQEK